MKRLLITFGCSWTYGVGASYTQGMSQDEYKETAWDIEKCEQLSFRGLLSKKYGFLNKNFASGGSSNQRQFRLAKEFFSSLEFEQLKSEFNKIIVLWGITSTARNEMWSLELDKLSNFFYHSQQTKLAKSLLKFCYNHDHEVRQLSTEMRHWNIFFKNLNIDNLWFDTFNHHDYEPTVENLIFEDKSPRDLLSTLVMAHGLKNPDNRYHHSLWTVDSNRVEYLVNNGILNPFSHHPTQQGHEQLADMLSSSLESIL